MKVIADSDIANLSTKLNNTNIGDILGYTYDEAEGWWYDGDKTSPLVNKMSSSTIASIGDDMNKLTVGDIFTEEDQKKGSFLHLIPSTTLVSELGSEVNKIFQNTTMGVYVEKGIIKLDANAQDALYKLDKFNSAATPWTKLTINEFIDRLVKSIKIPQN